LRKNVLDYILGDFFTHSSGHPDWKARLAPVYWNEQLRRKRDFSRNPVHVLEENYLKRKKHFLHTQNLSRGKQVIYVPIGRITWDWH
jgi:hypothetical protein